MKKFVVAVAAGLAALAAPAMAAPVAVTKDVGNALASESQVELVHGWHRSCQRDYRGWHYHGPKGRRYACKPVRRIIRRI